MHSQSSHRILVWLVLIIVMVLLALGALSRLQSRFNVVTALQSPSNSATVTPTVDSLTVGFTTEVVEHVDRGMATLKDVPKLTEMYNLTHLPPPFTLGPSPTPVTYTPRQSFETGIFDNQAAPLSPMGYAMWNYWQDIVNGEKVQIFAGARRDNPGLTSETSQGIVFVAASSLNEINHNYQLFEAPIHDTGILRITTVTGYRLTLEAESGAVLYFDVPTRRFVDSLSATVNAPTVTPLPPVTTTPTEQELPPICRTDAPYPEPNCVPATPYP